jgi:hypothetical protein
MKYFCFNCGNEILLSDRHAVGRADGCPKCKGDLHACKNCSFYDERAYNQCKEPQAERVLEKNRSNFCDYFEFAQRSSPGAKQTDQKAKALDALDALFKK